jgi:hypothetical protein
MATASVLLWVAVMRSMTTSRPPRKTRGAAAEPAPRARWASSGGTLVAVGALGAVTAALIALGCAASTTSAPSAGPGQGSPGSGGSLAGSGSDAPGGVAASGGTSGTTLPPEVEVESSYEAPIATGRYVWIANPVSGRVSYVDAATLAVASAEAGNGPTYLAPVPGSDDAVVVLNVLSHDATYLRATPVGLRSVMIPRVAPLANAWAISANGRWALAWADARRRPSGGSAVAADRLEGFQDVTAIDLAATPPVATTVAVGYRPVSVTFARDDARAFAVTEDGVSVIALPAAAGAGASGAPQVIRDVPLTSDPSESADTRDVSISSAAGLSRALVRREGQSDVRVVGLDDGATVSLGLDGPVTDLDVTPDGSAAVAVVRQTGSVYVIPLAAGLPDLASLAHVALPGETVGSVVLTADSKTAVLYSNAVASERLVVLDLGTGTSHVLRTHAAVLSVFPTPDAKFAVILHREVPGTGGDAPGTGGRGPGTGGAPSTGGASGTGGAAGMGGAPSAVPPEPVVPVPARAFSLVPLDGSRSGRIQGTEAVPQSIGVGPASDRVLVSIRDDVARTYAVYVASVPALEVQRFALASPPTASGVVAGAARGYVAQQHPEGRITFIPFDGTSLRTITGFELGARVVDGVTP